MKNRKALVIAAHPDDEILGCGGTIARLINEGYEAYTLVLGEGITSRSGKKGGKIEELKKQMEKADKLLGIKKVFELKRFFHLIFLTINLIQFLFLI